MNRRRLYSCLLLGACALLVVVSAVFERQEKQVVMGVPIMSERAYGLLPGYAYEEIGEYFTQNGQAAAVDRNESVIYISLNPQEHNELWRIPISIKLHHPRYRLYFAPDEAFENFEQAVLAGHRFTLIAVTPTHHMRYEVVFTTLPVIRLNTELGFDEGERKGSMCLWADYPSDEGYYCVSASQARWHRRGGTSMWADKPSYKVTLEKLSGENNNMTLLDMGNDDDWILNAMSKDDLKLREKTITMLWNEHQKTTRYQLPMSACRYAEVVIDGQYMGLYLLQRRVEKKLFGERYEGDAVYKGDENQGRIVPVGGALVIRENPKQVPEQELYDYITPFYELMVTREAQYDVLLLDEENWIDVNVFCSVFALRDNTGSKNIFLIRHEQGDEYVLHFVLWDTDMAMGLGWGNDDIRYKPENIKASDDLRREAKPRFAKDEELYDAYKEAYTQLRSDLLSQESIIHTVKACYQEITETGALQRDREKWGLHNNGEDTLENLLEFIQNRTAWLDETYLKQE